MERTIATRKTTAATKRFNKATRLRQAVCPSVCEMLEERQLMSLTIEVRSVGGGTSATVTSVGQVLNLEVLAVITDPSNAPTQDQLQDCTGSFLSTAVDGHNVAGNLTAANVYPFTANGASPGRQQTLDSSGNIDVGSNASGNESTADYFFARSATAEGSSSSSATVVGNSLEFEIATLTYTVTNLNEGGTTAINYRPYSSTTPDAAGWVEDGSERDNTNGTYQAGTAFTLSDAAIIPNPTAVNSSFNVIRNTPTTVDELAGDNIVVAINPNTVVIVTPPAHGTATPITSGATGGQILYTPTAGYTGADSFTYKMSDNGGRVSNIATVSITVVLPPPPTAGNVAATTFRNSPVTVNVLSSDSSVGTLVPSTVAVASPPANGTAVAQANGTIIYTPASGFSGTDTFTYTVGDSNQETSTAATVTITVTIPTPPTAGDLSSDVFEGTPTALNVSAVDTAVSGTLAINTIAIVTAPLHGTAVPNTDGTVLYTPTAGYIGADSFVYTIDDSLGDVSNQGTDSITVSHAAPPVSTDVVAPVVSGQSNTIDVLSNVSSGAPLVPGTVAIVTSPLHGTASVNSSTGAISYVPSAGFVGVDTFTYSVGNVNLDTSNISTVSLNVGATLSNAKGAAHSITFTNAAGGSETVTLNTGTAQLFFNNGTGTFAVAKNGKGTITGTGLGLTGITLIGTTKASTLVLKGSAKSPVSLPGITDASPLKSIVATNANVSGVINLNSASTVAFGTISNAQITVGAGLPGKFALTAGAVTDSSLTSAVPITSVKVASWVNSDGEAISAPSIASLTVAGAFDAPVSLSSVSPKVPALKSARIVGQLNGSLNTSAGSTIGTLYAGSVNSAWTANVGGLTSFTVKTGGLGASLVTTTLGSLVVNGGLTGNIHASTARTIRIVGDVTGSTIASSTITALTITGALTNATVTTTGSIGTISAKSINGSNISAGVTTVTSVSAATAATLGSSTIASLRSGSYINSTVLAGRISSASLGTVNNSNGGTPLGIAVGSINSFAGIFSTTPAHFAKPQLINEEVLQAYVQKQGTNFGDFGLQILG